MDSGASLRCGRNDAREGRRRLSVKATKKPRPKPGREWYFP